MFVSEVLAGASGSRLELEPPQAVRVRTELRSNINVQKKFITQNILYLLWRDNKVIKDLRLYAARKMRVKHYKRRPAPFSDKRYYELIETAVITLRPQRPVELIHKYQLITLNIDSSLP